MEAIIKLLSLLAALLPLIHSAVQTVEKTYPDAKGPEKLSAAMSTIEAGATKIGMASEELISLRPAVEGVIATAVRLAHDHGLFARKQAVEAP